MSTYTDKHREYYEKNKDRLKCLLAENQKKWIKTPKGIYSVQKRKAKQRGIAWNMFFDEWWSIWQESGKWSLRGDTKEKYCMCRTNDTGAYEIGNVPIDTFSNNTKECYTLHQINSSGQFTSELKNA